MRRTRVSVLAAVALMVGGGLFGAAGADAHDAQAGPATVAADVTAQDDGVEQYCDPGAGVCMPVVDGPAGWTQDLQGLIAPFAAQIAEVGAKYPDFGQTGLDYEAVAVQVWWHGPLPAELDPVIKAAADAGVGVEVIQTGYGEKTLDDAANAITDSWPEFVADDGNSIGPTNDFSGLQMSGRTISTDPDVQQTLRAIAERVAPGIPLTFVPWVGPISW